MVAKVINGFKSVFETVLPSEYIYAMDIKIKISQYIQRTNSNIDLPVTVKASLAYPEDPCAGMVYIRGNSGALAFVIQWALHFRNPCAHMGTPKQYYIVYLFVKYISMLQLKH